jgi:hypothetical protein
VYYTVQILFRVGTDNWFNEEEIDEEAIDGSVGCTGAGKSSDSGLQFRPARTTGAAGTAPDGATAGSGRGSGSR